MAAKMNKYFSMFCLLLGALAGCAAVQEAGNAVGRKVQAAVTPSEVWIIKYHVENHYRLLEEFTTRLYAKNPKYEPNPARRKQKLAQIFHQGPPVEREFAAKLSHEILAAAFSPEPGYPDRVYLLGLGLLKSIQEGYGLEDSRILWPGVKVTLERTEKLHHNLSQVNWRLKTYRDSRGDLLFLTNAAGPDGALNMGYEVIMTEILTYIREDIHLLGGLPGKYIFNMSALFMGIII